MKWKPSESLSRQLPAPKNRPYRPLDSAIRLPLPSQRMPLKAVVVGSCNPLAGPTPLKLMPSVVVATRIVMTSVFAFLGLPVTILVSAQLGVGEQLSLVEALSCFAT